MNYTDVCAWIASGGYAFLPAAFPWPSTDCIAYSGTALYRYGASTGAYTPSPAESAATNWQHSDQHTDKPPRKP